MVIEAKLQTNSSDASSAMSERVNRTPLYFRTESAPLFGWLHMPSQVSPVATGIVICPPIGYEYISCHRTIRHLADHLSAQGFPALRFDYHGTGDSSGKDEDRARVDAWLESIRVAIQQLKDTSGCTNVGLVGLRIGATLASVIAEELELECLILWAPCVHGKKYIREMAFLDRADVKTPERVSDDSDIQCAGFVISAETSNDLSKINLIKQSPRKTNILIVARDDLNDDFSLRDQWRQLGLEVDYIRMDGFADLLTNPVKAKVPFGTLSEIIEWIKDTVHMENIDSSVSLRKKNVCVQFEEQCYAQFKYCKSIDTISEKIIRFGDKNNLFGILCEPEEENRETGLPTIILSNSGAVHHVGTNRFYVYLARNLALAGFSTLRIDINGLGDSVIDDTQNENILYNQDAIQDIDDAIDYLTKSENKTRFVLAGLCFGSYASFHGSLETSHNSIVECVLINPLTFYWEEGMSLDDENISNNISSVKAYKSSMLKADRWLKIMRGKVDIRKLVGVFVSFISYKLRSTIKRLGVFGTAEINRKNNLSADLKKIVDSGKHVSFLIADKDPGYDLLMIEAKKAVISLIKEKKISIDIIPNSYHTFPTRESRVIVLSRLIENAVSRYHRPLNSN
jgi:alpha/beta superfamily hydrolase